MHCLNYFSYDYLKHVMIFWKRQVTSQWIIRFKVRQQIHKEIT